ncbi:hypothetical protein GOP47_0014336 [Adiantum capillus-veneris]|uniref:Uncharacterized protein n=1 Tax=Adiantum capillus-veneris TaxID=13818 RepID=A0A9D4UME4_ADICA|nr:hypothetical protein GOP47_0014336 [Adiantum capillus-veneris]
MLDCGVLGRVETLIMGKPKNKGPGIEEGTEEEEEKGRPAGYPEADTKPEEDERRPQEGGAAGGSGPTPTPPPVPAPRKRGRPRKVVPKVEETTAVLSLQSTVVSTDAESKKQKAESPSAIRNGTPPNEQLNTGSKLAKRAPLRREGSRRKSEPRRAAD